MPGRSSKPLLACVLILATALLGCGGDEAEKTIPPEDADQMLSTLDAAEAAIGRGECDLATEYANELVAQVNALPADVGAETKAGLREAADNVGTLVEADERCQPEDGTTGAQGAQPDEEEPTTEPATTTTTTTEEDTTETDEGEETDEDQPQEDSPPPVGPPVEGDDQGGGGGGDELDVGSDTGGIGDGGRGQG